MGDNLEKVVKHAYEVKSEEAWKEGWAKILRIRYISGASVFKILLNAGIWKFLGLNIAIISLSFSGIIISLILVIRRLVLKEIYRDNDFHNITHNIRNYFLNLLYSADDSGNESNTKKIFAERYDNFNDKIANLFASYYSNYINDNTICCAIRLAEVVDGKRVYTTVCRSEKMNELRKSNSVPLPYDEGIADYFRKKQEHGVCIIKDIKAASEAGIWREDKSDKLGDVKTLMIAPINARLDADDDESKSMIGLLYVTSQFDKFSLKHMNSIKGLADYLGTLYPLIFIQDEE